MTYQQLMNVIFNMTPEQRKQDVTIYIRSNDEYFPMLGDVVITEETDTLDKGHPYLQIEG
jgi:hypothetical protein